MKTIKSTNGFDIYLDDEDFELVSNYKWRAESHGRTYRACRSNCHTRNGNWYSKNAMLHRFILKCVKGQVVDHIDGNALNNQKENLRICTQSQNIRNRRPNINSRSKYKGITWNKREKKWVSRVCIDGKRVLIGKYFDEKEAALSYNISASFAYGEFSRLNKIW